MTFQEVNSQVSFGGDKAVVKKVATTLLSNKKEDVLKQRSTQYFGGSELARPDLNPFPQSSLTFNDQGIENIAALVFKGMQGC